jgi:hypothetical protein
LRGDPGVIKAKATIFGVPPLFEVANPDHNSKDFVDSPDTVIVNAVGPPVTAMPVSPNIGISCRFFCMLAAVEDADPVNVIFLLNTPSTSIWNLSPTQ